MAIPIRLYKFTKKLNSTLLPENATYDSFDCVLLDAQSVMNPIIRIEDPTGNHAMTEYTYAQIPEFSRYYFISNIVVTSPSIYTLYLQVDVLGSYKSDFLTTTQYVLRASNTTNPDLIDNIYPITPMAEGNRYAVSVYGSNNLSAYNNKTGDWSDISFFYTYYTNGAVLFGVTGQGNVSVDYYVCTVANFKSFINSVVTAVPTGGSWGTLPTGVQTALSNFMQYITFAKWIPFFPLTDNIGSSISSIYLGDQSFSITGYKVNAGLHCQRLKFGLTVPDHPLYANHSYYNFSPFREVNLFFMPIGNIPLDTTKLIRPANASTTVYVNMIVDLATANTEYTLTTASTIGFTSEILATGTFNIGVDLSLTEYSMSVEAAVASGLSYLMSNSINQWLTSSHSKGSSSLASSLLSGLVKDKTYTSSGGSGKSAGASMPEGITFRDGVARAQQAEKSIAQQVAENIYDVVGNVVDLSPVADALGSVSSFIASSFGQVSTAGHTGSFLMSVCTKPLIYCWFKRHTGEDYAKFGRPLFANMQLSSITGYCVCRGANYSGTNKHPLKPEVESINRLLNTGIYIE